MSVGLIVQKSSVSLNRDRNKQVVVAVKVILTDFFVLGISIKNQSNKLEILYPISFSRWA